MTETILLIIMYITIMGLVCLGVLLIPEMIKNYLHTKRGHCKNSRSLFNWIKTYKK